MDDVFLQNITVCHPTCFLSNFRGFKLTGPFVIMIYRMMAADLMKFGVIYIIFVMGFAQGSDQCVL
jgi:hypothetical protein